MPAARARGDPIDSHRRAGAIAGRSWPPRTCDQAATGSPHRQPLARRTRPDQPPWRHTRRRPGRARPYGECSRPAPPLGRRPPLREPSHHERRHHRQTAGGSFRPRPARHQRTPAPARSRHAGGGPREPQPRTTPAPVPRSPLPTPPRPVGRLRSVSAGSPRAHPPRRFATTSSVSRPRSPQEAASTNVGQRHRPRWCQTPPIEQESRSASALSGLALPAWMSLSPRSPSKYVIRPPHRSSTRPRLGLAHGSERAGRRHAGHRLSRLHHLACRRSTIGR